ncbi:hypothetical protein BC628DRAFT_662324 [Trametes gibbosa]|nr:hypothetical protein BC628DRAFT_662324 [Trametes gibbosa]
MSTPLPPLPYTTTSTSTILPGRPSHTFPPSVPRPSFCLLPPRFRFLFPGYARALRRARRSLWLLFSVLLGLMPCGLVHISISISISISVDMPRQTRHGVPRHFADAHISEEAFEVCGSAIMVVHSTSAQRWRLTGILQDVCACRLRRVHMENGDSVIVCG